MPSSGAGESCLVRRFPNDGIGFIYVVGPHTRPMTDIAPEGRPVAQLVYLLVGSFVLMVFSGIFFALGLPEAWARALFMGTVVSWVILGIAFIVQGRMEVSAQARVLAASKPTPVPKEGEDVK